MLTPVLRRIAGASIPFSILRIDKTFLIVSHTTFPYKTGKETRFDIHLLDFINVANANTIPTNLSFATDEKISS